MLKQGENHVYRSGYFSLFHGHWNTIPDKRLKKVKKLFDDN